MSLIPKSDCAEAVESIERWFIHSCNGDWEHKYGFLIESTDNPGWWATIKDLDVNKIDLSEIIGHLLRQYDAQVTVDGRTVRVFSSSLKFCLIACSTLLQMSEGRR